MTDVNEKILKQKEDLALQALQVADDALSLLQGQIEDCSTRDLVVVFNAAVKAHREITSDIIAISDRESKQEKDLAKDPAFQSKVNELLNRLQS